MIQLYLLRLKAYQQISIVLTAICLIFLLFTTASLQAQDESLAKMIILPSSEEVQGDYFAFGKNIEISGTVKGDLYVCGENIYVDGTVEGDILACGVNVELSGKVFQNIRLIAGQATISSSIGKNVTVVAANVQFNPGAIVSGNIVCVAGNVEIACPVGGNGHFIASNVRISSEILGSVEAYCAQLRLTSKVKIEKGIDYTSSAEAIIDPQAQIGGTIVHHPSLVDDLFKGKWLRAILIGSKIAGELMNFFYSLIIGLILISFFTKNLESAEKMLERYPLKALITGIVLLFLLPLVSLLLLMTILGAPFALALIALNIMSFYTAKIISITFISDKLASKIGFKANKKAIFSLGLILYFGLSFIPIFGFLISLAAMLFGIGATTLARVKLS